MKDSNNDLPIIYLNQFKNRKLALDIYFYKSWYHKIMSEYIMIYKKNRKSIKSLLFMHDNFNKDHEYSFSPTLKSSLFFENIRFSIYSEIIERVMSELKSRFDESENLSLMEDLIVNKNEILDKKSLTDQLEFQIIQFKDYIFHLLIIHFCKPKYKNFNFIQFLKRYKILLTDKQIDIDFREILRNLFEFIDLFFIKKEINDTINFTKKNIEQNVKLMKEYSLYLQNTVDLILEEFNKEKNNYESILNTLNINHDEFYNRLLDRYEDIKNSFFYVIEDLNVIENPDISDTSKTYNKRVSSILSVQNHFLTFIYNMNLIEHNNKKIFPILKFGLKDGIFFETILLSIPRRKIKYSFLNSVDDRYLIDLILNLKNDYSKNFRNLPYLFISHYVGLDKNESHTLANNINLMNTFSNSYQLNSKKNNETVNEKTYKDKFIELKKIIIKIKVFRLYKHKCIY